MNRLSKGVLIVLAGLAACGGDKKDATAAAKPDSAITAKDLVLTPAQLARIHVVPVTISAFRSSVVTTGTVAFNGDQSTQVLAPLSGPITKILVNPGDVVKKGAALATVTSPDFASAVAAYRKAESSYRNAQRIADLDEKLFKNDALARRDLEQAQTDATGAAADRDAAIEQMRALGVDEAQIEQVKDGKTASQMQAVIRAPIEGTVVEKLVNPGQLIQAGSTVCFTIADLSSVWVMANVFESDLSAVAAGEEVTITSSALGTPVIGHVDYVGALVDPASKATAVRVLAPNPRGLLKRDMLVNVSIKGSQGKNGVLVATSAVLRDDENLPFVYVQLPTGHFVRRPVTLGARTGDSYEVLAGVSSGDKVVNDGALFLQFAAAQ
jgi:cobalt-zinc-cadmium efflux system membrane fusion protein